MKSVTGVLFVASPIGCRNQTLLVEVVLHTFYNTFSQSISLIMKFNNEILIAGANKCLLYISGVLLLEQKTLRKFVTAERRFFFSDKNLFPSLRGFL